MQRLSILVAALTLSACSLLFSTEDPAVDRDAANGATDATTTGSDGSNTGSDANPNLVDATAGSPDAFIDGNVQPGPDADITPDAAQSLCKMAYAEQLCFEGPATVCFVNANELVSCDAVCGMAGGSCTGLFGADAFCQQNQAITAGCGDPSNSIRICRCDIGI